ISAHAPKSADLILVTHSHYDHALDVGTLAKRTHAAVAGTESTLNLVRAEGVAESELLRAAPHAAIDRGPFDVQVFRSLHSLTGQAYSEIPRAVHLPMNADGYGEGGTLQYLVTAEGRSVFFVGSANFVEAEINGLHPNVAVIATGLREKIPDYTCRLLHALGNPPLVIASHFDAFWKSLDDDTTLAPETRADLAKFTEEAHACSPLTRVVVPEHFQRFAL
ncbi:MAG: MBL fold metallo-hydrolase, partial [Polyangiaceae bacterium]